MFALSRRDEGYVMCGRGKETNFLPNSRLLDVGFHRSCAARSQNPTPHVPLFGAC